jgi:hypothetical protein
MQRGSKSTDSVPPEAAQTGRPLPSDGSSRVRSPPSSVRSADSDDSAAIAPHLWPSLGATLSVVLFATVGRTFRRRSGRLLARRPPRVRDKERLNPPGFPGNPCVHALLTDPGGPPASSGTMQLMLPSAIRKASAPHLNLSRLNHTAYTPSVYASQPGSLPVHATLDSGGSLALTGSGLWVE